MKIHLYGDDDDGFELWLEHSSDADDHAVCPGSGETQAEAVAEARQLLAQVVRDLGNL